MKYTGLILLIIISCSAFSSCNTDKRSIPDEMNVIKEADKGVKEIKIEGIKDLYAIPSLGNLSITPKITTDYPEDDLSYKWVMYPTSSAGSRNDDDKIQSVILGRDKTLNRPMTISSGRYKAYLKVTSKATDVSAFYPFTVDIARVRGFFVLKEVETGNQTDIDFYSIPEDGTAPSLSTDIYKSSFDTHLDGKPLAFDVLYHQSFLDPDSLLLNKEIKSSGNTFFVTTDKNDNKFIRYSDFKEVLASNQRFYFSEYLNGIRYYRAIRTFYHSVLFSNKGIFSTYNGDAGSSYRGTWGEPSEGTEGCQIEHSFLSSESSDLIYWNARTKSLEVVITFGDPLRLSTDYTSTVTGYPMTNIPYDPMFGGAFIGGGANKSISVFLFNDPSTQKRILYRLGVKAMDSVEVFSGESAIAKATLFAINTGASTTSAPILYCVVGNKIFGHNLWADIPDRDMTPAEISPAETISYISCQYWKDAQESDHDFDNMIIGTQNGDDYKIYMYKTIGGAPDGAPVHVFQGRGQIKRVCYAAPVHHGYKSYYSITEK